MTDTKTQPRSHSLEELLQKATIALEAVQRMVASITTVDRDAARRRCDRANAKKFSHPHAAIADVVELHLARPRSVPQGERIAV